MSKDFFFILGGPGSGKGTQSAYIAKQYGIGYLSTGDLLRAAIKKVDNPPEDIDPEELEKLKALAELMKSGALVDDRTVIGLIKDTMNKGSEKHWFIDGFPRNTTQNDIFVEECGDCAACLYIKVSDEILTQRLLKRGETSGRADDNEESIKKRLNTYHTESEDVIKRYTEAQKVIEIDGERDIEAVRADCIEGILKIWPDLKDQVVGEETKEEEKTGEEAKKEKKEEEHEVQNSKCCLLI